MAKNLRMRAATALDLTHPHDTRGPKTFMTRRRVADWLDTGRGSKIRIASDVAWLMKIAAAHEAA